MCFAKPLLSVFQAFALCLFYIVLLVLKFAPAAASIVFTGAAIYTLWRWFSETTAKLRASWAEAGVFGQEFVVVNFDRSEVFVRTGRMAASMTLMSAIAKPLPPSLSSIGALITVVRSALRGLGPLSVPHSCVKLACNEAAEASPQPQPQESQGPQAMQVVAAEGAKPPVQTVAPEKPKGKAKAAKAKHEGAPPAKKAKAA